MQNTLFVIPVPTGVKNGAAPDPEAVTLAAEYCRLLDGLYPRCRTIAVTNDKMIESSLKNLEATTFLYQANSDNDDPEPLPVTLSRNETLIRRAREMGMEHVFVLDVSPGAPGINEIPNAMQAFKESDAPALFSISCSRDHPCQLKSYFNIAGLGMLHMVETNLPSRRRPSTLWTDTLQTKTFAFDWPSAGVEEAEAGALFARTYSNRTVTYDKVRQPFAKTGRQPLFMYEDRDTARLLFLRDWSMGSKNDLMGVSFDSGFNTVLTLERDSAGLLRLKVAEDSDDANLVIRLCGLMGDVNYPMNLDIPFAGSQAQLPETISLQGVHACTYVLLRESANQIFDLTEPYPLDNGMWTFDKLIRKNINSATGREISGRQDFPDIYEIDGYISVFKVRDAYRLKEILGSGESFGYKTSKDSCLAGCKIKFRHSDAPLEKDIDKGRAIA